MHVIEYVHVRRPWETGGVPRGDKWVRAHSTHIGSSSTWGETPQAASDMMYHDLDRRLLLLPLLLPLLSAHHSPPHHGPPLVVPASMRVLCAPGMDECMCMRIIMMGVCVSIRVRRSQPTAATGLPIPQAKATAHNMGRKGRHKAPAKSCRLCAAVCCCVHPPMGLVALPLPF